MIQKLGKNRYVITVDTDNMPPKDILSKLKEIEARFEEKFPGTKVLVIPRNL